MKLAVEQEFVAPMLRLLAAPLIWAAHFGLIYFVAGFAPAFGLGKSGVAILCWIATGVAIAAVLLRLRRERRQNIDRPSPITAYATGLAFLSLVAIVLQAIVLALLR